VRTQRRFSRREYSSRTRPAIRTACARARPRARATTTTTTTDGDDDGDVRAGASRRARGRDIEREARDTVWVDARRDAMWADARDVSGARLVVDRERETGDE